MPTPIEKLTSGELSTSLTAARFLVQMGRTHGLLEPVLRTKLVALAVDLEAQTDEREALKRASLREAMESKS